MVPHTRPPPPSADALHVLCHVSDYGLLFTPITDGPSAVGGGEGDREGEDDEDGPSDAEGGEEDGTSYSRLRKQQVCCGVCCSYCLGMR